MRKKELKCLTLRICNQVWKFYKKDKRNRVFTTKKIGPKDT